MARPLNNIKGPHHRSFSPFATAPISRQRLRSARATFQNGQSQGLITTNFGHANPPQLAMQSMRSPSNPVRSGVIPHVSRDAGAHRGTLANYNPWRPAPATGLQERITAGLRSEDLVANDWGARSLVDTITLNAVGANGLFPQSTIPAAILGLDEEEARQIGDQMEAIFRLWSVHAGFDGQAFADLQFMGMRSALIYGELLHVPVMIDNVLSPTGLSLSIQAVHPERLCTPSDMRASSNMRDGVELDHFGRPCAVWVAEPEPSFWSGVSGQSTAYGWSGLSSDSFRRLPMHVAHRKGIFHCFRHINVEQYRGEPVLAPALKLFRHLADSLDYELIGQIVSASFPLFIKVADGSAKVEDFFSQAQNGGHNTETNERVYHQQYAPGQVLYGNEGDDAKPLVSDRPGANWASFVQFIVRAMGASAGIPYESLLKDFSKTNYSSARAALLEAWRVYMLWRQWQARSYCQPIYSMVVEEAYLRGLIKLPRKAPSFYEAMPLWTSAIWMGAGRGSIDPVKEANANITLLQNGLATYGEVLGERGLSPENVWAIRGNEEQLMRRLAPDMANRIMPQTSGPKSEENNAT